MNSEWILPIVVLAMFVGAWVYSDLDIEEADDFTPSPYTEDFVDESFISNGWRDYTTREQRLAYDKS